jgi:ParB family transcriptional regulator, chromosome partitioning protein
MNNHVPGRAVPQSTKPTTRRTIMTMTTEATEAATTLYIPLDRLKKSPKNARKIPHPKADIESLAASIAAKGLLQNLVVEPECKQDGKETGYYLVTIGEGRRLAHLLRAKRKEIAKAAPVRCILDTAHNAHEISLAENVIRSAMHPADQFEAWAKLHVEHGMSAEDIAARFGVSPGVVRQRLKLGAVSPKLMQLYKDEAMNLEQLMAFTVSDDHAAQESAWDELAEWNRRPQTIRAHLTREQVRGDDRRACFVTLDAYKAAGGHVTTDLFRSESYLADPALLDKLCAEKLETEAEAVRAEGWKWVEIMTEASYDALAGYERQKGKQELSAKQEKQLGKLRQQRDGLAAKDEYSDEDAAAIDSLDAEIEGILADSLTWSDRQKKRCGAIVGIGHDGKLDVTRGLIAPADQKTKASESRIADTAEALPKAATGLSAALAGELTAHRTMALRAVLADLPVTGLVAVVHSLITPLFYDQPADTALDIRAVSVWLRAEGIDNGRAAHQLAERHATWLERLPKEAEALWDWLTQQDLQTLVLLLGYGVAHSIKAERSAACDRIASALDMAHWWEPTAAGYLGRVSKPLILEAVTEGVGEQAADNIATLKKGEMAAMAESLLKGKGWLPEMLRTGPAMEQEAEQAA